MTNQGRPKFRSIKDWHDFIDQRRNKGKTLSGAELRTYRKGVYEDIEDERDRELLVFASAYPRQYPEGSNPPISITLEDIDGFTDLVNESDADAVDILLHSPGGTPDATERIVKLLRTSFDSVSFLIPHSAYSAATMLALSGDEIILHPSASLGPIDPQINGTPARAIKKGFENVRDRLEDQGPEALPAYIPLIEKYSLHLLEMCDDSEKLAKGLVKDWICDYMLPENDDREEIADEAAEFFSAYETHKIHSRPLTFQDVNDLDLNISLADGTLKELIREAYINLYGLMSVSPMVKIYENSRELSWGKNFRIKQGGQDEN